MLMFVQFRRFCTLLRVNCTTVKDKYLRERRYTKVRRYQSNVATVTDVYFCYNVVVIEKNKLNDYIKVESTC